MLVNEMESQMDQPPRPPKLEKPASYNPEPREVQPLIFLDEDSGDILDLSPKYSDPKELIPTLLNREEYSEEELKEADYTEDDEDDDEEVTPKTKEEIMQAINPPRPQKPDLLKLVTNNQRT